MNLLDENFPADQLPLLEEWHISFRRIGHDVARHGVKDPDIVPLLHRHRGVTFFTLDRDFFEAGLSHPAYGIAWLDIRADDAAHFVRRFLKHPLFGAKSHRMGVVARVHREGIDFWQRNHASLHRVNWLSTKRK